jgi:hypothetical protein
MASTGSNFDAVMAGRIPEINPLWSLKFLRDIPYPEQIPKSNTLLTMQ